MALTQSDDTKLEIRILVQERDEMADRSTNETFDASQLKNHTLAHKVYDAVVKTQSCQKHYETFCESTQIKNLQSKINYNFKDKLVLTRAFTHSSFVHEYSEEIKSYERLEFLGDSILGAYVSQELFKSFDNFSEGKLSKLKSALVNEDTLSELSMFLGLDTFVLRGKGELKEELTNSIKCDVFESLIGAVAVDSSLSDALNVLEGIIKLYEKESEEVFFSEQRLVMFDPKSTLQEYTMKNFGSLPKYEAMRVEDKFCVELWIEGQKKAEAINISKKAAMKEVALNFLNKNKEISKN